MFRYEREMTESARQWLLSEGLCVRGEYVTPYGICDLVGVQMDLVQARRRIEMRQGRPVTDVWKLVVLEQIPNSDTGLTVTLEGLQHQLDQREDVVLSATHWLLKNRFITASSAGFQRRCGWTRLAKRIVAVELKLERFNEALQQAVDRLAFATESYVGFPENEAIRLAERNIDRLRQTGVGVLAIAPWRCRELVPSNPSGHGELHAVMRAQCVERFWPEIKRELQA